MKQTVVGVFDRYEQARQAAETLATRGIPADHVHVTAASESSEYSAAEAARADQAEDHGLMARVRSFFAEVFGAAGHDDVHEYAEHMRRGGAVVKVDVDDEARIAAVRDALQAAGAVDIDERVAEWREAGWEARRDAGLSPGLDSGMAAATGAGMAAGTARRDDVGAGGVRIYGPAGERPTASANRPFEDYRDEFRADHGTRYGSTVGSSFEDYGPAYQYGHELAADPRYGDRDWDAFEPEARSDWERRHPDRPWERFKDAVRHAWQRVKS